MNEKLAFVIPWYGKNISGGAENECKGIVEHLHKSGVDVEILTTCVKDFNSDWNKNYYKEGIEIINDIPVRRFKVRKRDTVAFDSVNYKLINNMPVSDEEEKIFFEEMVNSIDLQNYIYENQNKYKAFVFIPYMFGTTYNGSKMCPSNSALISCLHDESYAYMKKTREMFERVKKIIFLAKPEYELANNIYNLENVRQGILGAGLETEFKFDKNRFKEKYKIDKPFILYAGRKDSGKKVDILLKYFEKLCSENNEIQLVLIGGGEITIPNNIKHRVYDLGFVDIQDKYDAYSAAICLCQPSVNESFSIVIMESWITGVPVLVNEKCKVTANFAKESNGGLYFDNYNEFKECVLLYLNNEKLRNIMGKLGKRFVKENFSWDVIVDRYKKFLIDN